MTQVLLKNLTTVGLGGPAKNYLAATNPEELVRLLKNLHQTHAPYFLLGGGSNLLVSDQGIDRVVVHNKVSGLKLQNKTVVAQSGTPLQLLVNFTVQNGLSGLQKMTGIPGTLGGAIYGNAGAYGQTISDQLVLVKVFDGEKIVEFNKTDCQFSYRNSIFKENKFPIIEATFKFISTSTKKLRKEAEEILQQRFAHYSPGLKCPGSFFKNIFAKDLSPKALKLIPEDKIMYGKIPAGYLLEMVGAKNQRLGNIQISPDHGNLFINLGNGTTGDFLKLAQTYAQKVKEKYGITLEPEVQLVNLPPLI